MITVVAAVIEEHGRFLITSRPPGTHLAGMWEFPGGKVGTSETHAEALRRELGEELDADADVHQLLLSTAHAYPDRTVCLFFYRCTLKSPAHPALGQQMQWVLPEELHEADFPEADVEVIRLLTGRAI